MDLGQKIKAVRKQLGMSQTDFAAAGGVKRGAQVNYENGSRIPDAAYCAAIRLLDSE